MDPKEMTLKDITERRAAIKTELTVEGADLDALEEEIRALDARETELKEAAAKRAKLEGLIKAAPVISTGILETTDLEEREARAKALTENHKIETRALLSTGQIATPTKVGGINGMADTVSTIVDDVTPVSLTGNGAYIVAYKQKGGEAADVTDGEEIGGTEPVYDYVTINPTEWGIVGTVSRQVAKVSPLAYLNAVESDALTSLRARAEKKIFAAVKASALAEKVTAALDENYLRNLMLNYKGIAGKGAVKLYLCREDLVTLGKVRGTNEKKPLYSITFDVGSNVTGQISEGGLAVAFCVTEELTKGTQLFGQPRTIEMPMWDGYTIETDESVYFTKNLIAYRGLQTANADLCALHGMQIVSNSDT